MLNSSIVLHIGNKIASIIHIKSLLKSVPKDTHFLVHSDIVPEDRQNYRALEKVMDDRVLNAMKTNVVDCEGTVMYLKLCKLITSSFTSTNLNPADRIYHIWYAVYFLRCWRKNIQSSDEHSLEQNFISSNAYACVEINAHSLIEIVKKMRSNKQEKLFLPSFFASQPCENIFRMMRSLSTINFTKINFSLSELFHMISRVEMMNKIIYNSNEIEFPRVQKTDLRTDDYAQNFPSDKEIQSIIESARDAALENAILFGIHLTANDIANTELLLYKSRNKSSTSVRVDTNVENANEIDTDQEDAMEDKILSENEHEHQRYDQYVCVLDSDGNEKKILKSRFIWMQCESKDKISSDRLKRVQQSSQSNVKRRKKSDGQGELNREANLFKSDEIMIGDWVIFDLKFKTISPSLENDVAELNGCIIGMIIGFRCRKENEHSQQHKVEFVTLSDQDEKKNRCISCLVQL